MYCEHRVRFIAAPITQLYRIERLHPLGHPVTTAVTSTTIKDTPYIRNAQNQRRVHSYRIFEPLQGATTLQVALPANMCCHLNRLHATHHLSNSLLIDPIMNQMKPIHHNFLSYSLA
jgi:hypothetical protein